MSPILVRPIREQLEHDRIIRQLQVKYKRKLDVGINVGAERIAPAGSGASAVFPDLVLQTTERGKKLAGVVEVETSESVNHLEALAEWSPYSKLRVPFHLYVPANSIDTARRLCTDHQVEVTELWTYHAVGDQMRFTLMLRVPPPVVKAAKPTPRAAVPRAAVAAPRAAAAAPGPRPRKAAPVASRTRVPRAAKAVPPPRARGKNTTTKPAHAQKRK